MIRGGDGDVTMAFGVMGGAYQPCGHARFISNMVDFGMDAQTAIDSPRCFAEDGTLRLERGYSDAARAALAEYGPPHHHPPRSHRGGAGDKDRRCPYRIQRPAQRRLRFGVLGRPMSKNLFETLQTANLRGGIEGASYRQNLSLCAV